MSTEEVARLLHHHGFARAPFHPHGLLTAADVVGLAHTLSLERFGGAEWLIQKDQEMIVRTSVRLARSIVATHGACSLADLQAKVNETTSQAVSEDTLRDRILGPIGVSWIDSNRQWFRFPSKSSSLERTLWKILAVAPEIGLGELREGLMRHHRAPAAPPLPVLRGLCRHLGLDVDEDIIRTPNEIRAEEFLSDVELVVFDILCAEGPLLTAERAGRAVFAAWYK